MERKERTEKVARSIQIVAESLISHIPHTYGELSAAQKRMGESPSFHKKCVREYVEVLDTLSQFL